MFFAGVYLSHIMSLYYILYPRYFHKRITTGFHQIPTISPYPPSGGFFLTNQGVAVKLDNVTNQIVLVNDIEVFWVGGKVSVWSFFAGKSLVC